MNWYYVINGQQTGPITEAQLEELARAGTIKADTLVWAEGMPNWVPYSQARQPVMPGQPPIMAQPSGNFGGFQAASSEDVAKKLVQGPGIALIVSGAIGLLASLANLAQVLFGAAAQREQIRQAFAEMPPEFQQMADFFEMMLGPLGIAMAAIGVLLGAFTIFSGVQMQRLRNFWMPLTASIFGILSCFSGCCCVSLPIGIWALVVLMKPEVKSAFK